MHASILTLLLFAGLARASDTLDPGHASCGPVALLPRGLTSFGAATLDGWLYVYGGYHGEPHAYSRAGQSGEFYRIDLCDPRQVEMLDGDGAIQGATLAGWDGCLVRVGGMIARNASDEPQDLHSSAECWTYDPLTRAFRALPDLPRARSSHDMVVRQDRIYVLGGWTLDGKAPKSFAGDVAILDLRHVELGWRLVEAPFQRRALAVALLGDRIAAIGGLDPEGEVQARVDLFDPEAGTWSTGPDFPGRPFGVAATTLDGAIHASGQDGVVWRLDAGAPAWRRVSTLCFPRFFHRLVDDGAGRLLALGGIDDMRSGGRVRHVERCDPRPRSAPDVSLVEVPAPGRAKNRQGIFLRGDRLTFFGGNHSLRQHDFAREDFSRETWSLDLATLAWTARADFPEGRQTIASLIDAGDASGLALGGFGFGDDRALTRAASYRYAFDRDAWQPATDLDLPSPRTQFGLASTSHRIWVFGGLDFDPARGDEAFVHPLDVLELDRADPRGRFHDSQVRLTTPRRAFACASSGERVFLVGGMRGDFETVDECESFDAGTRRFAPIARPRRARVSADLVALGSALYLCGGSSRGPDGKLAPDASIERYDPREDRWETVVERLPEPLPHARAFALRDRIVMVTNHAEGPPRTRIVFVAP